MDQRDACWRTLTVSYAHGQFLASKSFTITVPQRRPSINGHTSTSLLAAAVLWIGRLSLIGWSDPGPSDIGATFLLPCLRCPLLSAFLALTWARVAYSVYSTSVVAVSVYSCDGLLTMTLHRENQTMGLSALQVFPSLLDNLLERGPASPTWP